MPDEVKLKKFGRMLRSTSLDELPEAFNILKGDMSVIGPRPQPVIVWQTFKKVFVRNNITESNKEVDVTFDYGDSLLHSGKITRKEYETKQAEARQILGI